MNNQINYCFSFWLKRNPNGFIHSFSVLEYSMKDFETNHHYLQNNGMLLIFIYLFGRFHVRLSAFGQYLTIVWSLSTQIWSFAYQLYAIVCYQIDWHIIEMKWSKVSILISHVHCFAVLVCMLSRNMLNNGTHFAAQNCWCCLHRGHSHSKKSSKCMLLLTPPNKETIH